MSAVKIAEGRLLPSGNSVNSAARLPPWTPAKPPKNTRSRPTLFTIGSSVQRACQRAKVAGERHNADQKTKQEDQQTPIRAKCQEGQDRDLQRERHRHALAPSARVAGQRIARHRLS